MQQHVQFDGLPDEDPNAHIVSFLETCDIFKINRAMDDAIKFTLFSFLLRTLAK